METLQAIWIPLLLTLLVVGMVRLSLRWGWKLLINSVGGFLSLLLLNAAAPVTGLYLPVNPVTVTVSGFLGLPGLAVLALAQIIL